ncbi:molybdenum ABC transporter ATP-binding protein, partial [Mesorhizobium sp. M7A.F.Ca.CA.003.01.2.1]
SRQALKLHLGGKVFAVIKTVSFDRANTGAGLPPETGG